MNAKKAFYRWVQITLIKPLLSKTSGAQKLFQQLAVPIEEAKVRIWFHAASVGELEALTPIIFEHSKHVKFEIVITIFSESAQDSLKHLVDSLQFSEAKVIAFGFSPWEGEWLTALRLGKPKLFVTVKYEAWPDLWMSLHELTIPLMIVATSPRSSLLWAKRICAWLGAPLPKMILLTNTEADAITLQSWFNHAEVQCAGEPRWDQVRAKMAKQNLRSLGVVSWAKALPKPWGVLGSLWPEDLKVWRSTLSGVDGTLWFVPHKVETSAVVKFRNELERAGFLVFLSSEAGENEIRLGERLEKKCVLVDEMGILFDLYRVADWAFIGGGFGPATVHSTIEPAIFGIPIAVGPKGCAKFSEISVLAGNGQLTIVDSPRSLKTWYQTQRLSDPERRAGWKMSLVNQYGATSRVVSESLRQIEYLQDEKKI